MLTFCASAYIFLSFLASLVNKLKLIIVTWNSVLLNKPLFDWGIWNCRLQLLGSIHIMCLKWEQSLYPILLGSSVWTHFFHSALLRTISLKKNILHYSFSPCLFRPMPSHSCYFSYYLTSPYQCIGCGNWDDFLPILSSIEATSNFPQIRSFSYPLF